MAQAPNTSLTYDPNTSRIVDLKNHTITIIDKKTDQPVRVCNFTPKESANITTNNTVAVGIGNVTSCENLTPVKPTINDLTTDTENATSNSNLTPVKPTINDLTTDTENATSNVNLTAKFNDLQGK
jgi:hypothetical protein